MTRILVKMPNWVGDCVMATPAMTLIKTALPGVKIDALIRPGLAGLILDNPQFDKVIAAHDKKMPPEVVAEIRATKYDAVALLTNSIRSAWMAYRFGIPRRIGFNREGRGILLTDKLHYDALHWVTPAPKPLSRRSIKGTPVPGLPRHMVEYYLEIARATVNAIDPDAMKSSPTFDPKMVLPLNRDSEKKVAGILRDAGIIDKTLIGINPGAAQGSAKRWPPERMGHLVDGLQRADWAFVSTAGPAEKHLNDEVQAVTKVKIHRLGEQMTLRDLPALMSRLAILVTNDSGGMHVAAARQVPCVGVVGSTDWPNTHPWECPKILVQHPVPCSPCFLESCPIDHPCMMNLQPYAVAEATLQLMNQTGTWKPVQS